MSTPTPAPDNNTTAPPPLTVSAPQLDTPSSTPPAPDSVPSPVSTSPTPPDTQSPSSDSTTPPPPDTQSPFSDSTSPPSPALAPPPDTELPPPAFASPPPPASAAPPDNQLPPPPTAPAPPTPAVSPPPPPSTSSPSPPPPSTSSPSPPPPSTSSPPPSSDSSSPPSTSSPPATSASPPPPSSSPPNSSASPPPPTSSPPSSSASPASPSTSSPPSFSASPPPPSTSSPPSFSASPPPPSTSSPSTSASPPPSTTPPPSASAPPPSTFPSSPSTSPPPPSTSSPPTSAASPTTPRSISSPQTSSASPTTPPLTSSPPTSSASPTPPPSASSPPTSSASSTPTPSSFLPPSSSAFPPPPPSTSSTSPSLLLTPPPPLNSGSTPVDSSSSGISVAVVVGIAIGGVAILLVLILLFVCYRKKRRNHDAEAFHAQPPFAGYKDVPYGGPLPGPIMRLLSNASAPLPVNAHAPPFLLPSFNRTGSRYSGHETPPPPPPPGSVLGSSKSSFSYEELALATNGFSEANLLGQGGFGYVHRGVLPNGKEVAIKQLKAGSGQGEREFQAEVEIISRVHHKHLVSLVGYCITGSQRLLVYEYIPNNNLEFHLHEKGRPTLDWSARVRIALGSAKGLSYLHEDCNPKIIHRDIKAANILIDFKFEAKVADFGLAKFTLDIHTHVSTRVMGTFGYLAPEYASSGKLSEKSDVFSFGVVLLELITGHRPVDTTQTFMEDSLVDWARPLLVRAIEDENYDGLVDPKLQGNFIPTEMARMVACAAACVRHSAKRRPRMIQVVRALEGDATLADLNKGVRPGPSSACDESSDYDTTQYKEDMKKFRKMALESQEYGATGVAYSCGTSEYGLYPSSSSSSDAQTSREMEMKRWGNESLGLS